MSNKITGKNLHYDSSLPPFLARMQANQNARDGRQEFTVARSKKPKSAEEEAEDEPVIFDEVSGESLTRKQWEEREGNESTSKLNEENEDDKLGGESHELGQGKEEEGGIARTKEKVAEIGGGKKRKVGKVIGGGTGDDDEDASETNTLVSKKAEGDKKAAQSSGKDAPSSLGKKVDKGGKSSKKGKKIKLSFGDDE